MVHIDLIIRTNRRSVSISINQNGNVIVKAPRYISIDKLQQFVDKKENWINEHRGKILNTRRLNENLFNYKDMLFLGDMYHILYSDNVKKIELKDNYCIIPTKYSENIVKHLKKFYKNYAETILWGRVEYFCNLMQVSPNALRLSNATRCWGSCNNKGVVSLNFRLILLPHNLIDYVIVHELAHLVQLNHSKLFWEVVGSVLQDYKYRKKQLNDGSYLLNLIRE